MGRERPGVASRSIRSSWARNRADRRIVFRMATSTSQELDGLGSAERAYELIRTAIIEGRYRPGQRLIEQRIGEEFNLSRTPVRESLRSLEAEGLVISERNRGAIVRPISAKDIFDLYELRARLESLAAERASHRASTLDLAELDAAIEDFDRAIPSTPQASIDQIRGIDRANAHFHGAVLRIADDERLSQLLSRTIDIPLVFQAFRLFDRDERVRSNLFHRLIRNAIEAQEPDRAGALMAEHIFLGRDALLVQLEKVANPNDLFETKPELKG